MDGRIEIIQGDITRQAVDVIVNAANTALMAGGGVDGAIHRAAGPHLQEECSTLGGCPVGEVRVTRAYDLQATWVVHAVGPIWRGGGQDEDAMLASAYRKSLAAAADLGARSIAFPLISTGAYAFPLDRACGIALREMQNHMEGPTTLERIVVVCFGRGDYETCLSVAEGIEG